MDTLRAQMEDAERGARIKALRDERHLTQPAVVELFENLARRAGWEPKRAGDSPLTLRGYQTWEAGGGIKWDNAKLLAKVFDVEAEYLMSGRTERPGTPDLSLIQGAAREDQVEDGFEEFRAYVAGLEERLERIDGLLTDSDEGILALLAKQARVLEDIRTLVGDEDAFAAFRRALDR